jgi:isoleucyl-tRNA synthetase
MNDDIKKTLRTPNTNFPLRGNLVELDKKITEYWNTIDLYETLQKARQNKEPFVLHQGPPFTNGRFHIGHGLTGALKAIVVATFNILGYRPEVILGWDCHGLPIETRIKSLGQLSKHEFYNECRKFSQSWIEIQKPESQKLCYIHSKDYYSTMRGLPRIYEAFSKLLLKGDVLIKNKPIIWSVAYKCNIPDIDIEYKNKKSTAMYLYHQVKGQNFGLLIFTTTPWSIFDNMFICINKNFEYVLIEYENRSMYVAKDALSHLNELIFNNNYNIISSISGTELLAKNYQYLHAIYGHECSMLHGDHVSTDGTGLVHTAPAHGPEDYDVAYRINKRHEQIVDLISDDGFIVYNGEKFHIIEDINKILHILQSNIVHSHVIEHSYPFYKDHPLIYKTSEQIYLNIDSVRDSVIKQLDNIQVSPENLLDRLKTAIRTREEWCVSRNRTYGVPLALFVHKIHRTLLIDNKVQDLIIEQMNIDPTYFLTDECINILPEEYKYNYEPYMGILDCWFDSACASPVIIPEFEMNSISSVYIEGKDQLRGWFNSSAFLSVMLTGKLPYKGVITHGFVVNDKREKMSKSKDNSISLSEIFDQIGLDVFFILVADSNFKDDVAVSTHAFEQAKIKYMKFRGVLRYLCSVVEYGHKPLSKITSTMERAFLWNLRCVIEEYISLSKSYEIHFTFDLINNFIVDLSSIYFNACKDCLYADGNTIRRNEIIHTCYLMLNAILMMLAPFIPRTCEEIFLYMKNLGIFTGNSIHEFDLSEFYSKICQLTDGFDADFTIYEEVSINVIPLINAEIESLKQSKQISKNSDIILELQLKDSRAFELVQCIIGASDVLYSDESKILLSQEDPCIRCSRRTEKSLCKRCDDFIRSHAF